MMPIKKICLITCYRQPDYVRAKTLRAAFGALDDVELIVVKNRHVGLLRYPEVAWKLMMTRIRKQPDIYFLTFRGYEMIPLVRLLTLGKPLIFDEFINLIEWVVYEHHRLAPHSLTAKLLWIWYRFWLKKTTLIVSDTVSHARYSARLMKLPLDRYVPLIVSTDEQTFGRSGRSQRPAGGPFKVFYYGSMLPLQGVDTILAAMRLLKDQAITLTLIGGKKSTSDLVETAKLAGTKITYLSWVPFDELPHYINEADVCLGGPFGDTVQSRYVIGGKTYQFLRMGCPVIIGKNHESDLWTDKKDALIVRQAQPQELADAIMWAKQNPDSLQKIGEAGQVLYERSLSNGVLAEELRLLLAHERIL